MLIWPSSPDAALLQLTGNSRLHHRVLALTFLSFKYRKWSQEIDLSMTSKCKYKFSRHKVENVLAIMSKSNACPYGDKSAASSDATTGLATQMY